MNALKAFTLCGLFLMVGNPFVSRDTAIAGSTTEGPEDTRAKFILYSKTDPNGFKFTIFPYDRERIIRFQSNSGRQEIWVTSLNELGKLLDKLPQRSVVVWTDDVRRHMIFPSPDIMRRAKELAAKKDIDLQVISSFYD